MFCTNCGMPLSEGAKFCGNCGTQIMKSLAKDPGPAAGPEAASETIARETGASVSVESEPSRRISESEGALPRETAAGQFVPGVDLYRFRMVDRIMGKSAFPTNLGIGTLFVYDNGLRFAGIADASVGAGHGRLGAVLSTAVDIAQSFDPNAYPLEQIKELSVGKRLGIYDTLTIAMKNKDV